MIQSIRDVVSAYDNGRWHHQYFMKNPGLAGDNYWQDWAFASGKPGVNARIGDVAAFTPMIAIANQAIYFPAVPTVGQERRLAELNITSTASGASQTSCAFLLYDLVGTYPLLDGDSTDPQIMDNTLTLPRYTSGDGIRAVLVNHVSGQAQAGTGVYSYVCSHGDTETNIPFGVANVGLNKVASTGSQASNATIGSLFLPQGIGDTGIQYITSLQFVTPPSGVWCLYLLKPLAWISNNDGQAAGPKCSTEKMFVMHDSCRMPRIYDGAHLGFFYMPIGGSRTVSMAGHAVFIWG